MVELLYIANVSLDGYTEDERGSFEFTEPGDDVFAFITDLIRPVGTHVYGRRMYDTMAVWETEPALADQSALMADFARVWQAAEKVVISSSLDAASTTNTRLERAFDAESIRASKASAAGDLAIGGPTLAAHAFAARLVDEVHLFTHPIAVGGGKPAMPRGVRVDLELVDVHRFSGGVVHTHHRTVPAPRGRKE